MLAVDFIEGRWKEILPVLSKYITIPNLSPAFDASWAKNGHMDRAVGLIESWCSTQNLPGRRVAKMNIEGRTPIIFIDIPATDGSDKTVLLYGHLDKQPECGTWREGLSPWTPVQDGDRLYGRGGADDGYAVFAAVTAIQAIHEQGVPHARCVIIIEASEESGSPDLPAHIEALGSRIGKVDLVICLDSSCGDYDHLWRTTSLRGVVMADLRVDVLEHSIHSGSGGGLVDSSFLILSKLLLLLEEQLAAKQSTPTERYLEAQDVGMTLGLSVLDLLPWLDGKNPLRHSSLSHNTISYWIMRNTWEFALAVTGIDGIPPLEKAANVLRPYTTARISLRIPPMESPEETVESIRRILRRVPLPGVNVTFTPKVTAEGWNAPTLAPWLKESLNVASNEFFGNMSLATGEGGTIPFMGMLGKSFPNAQFLVTGVLGPESNAHGPNEFLHIPTAKKVTACVAQIIADHSRSR